MKRAALIAFLVACTHGATPGGDDDPPGNDDCEGLPLPFEATCREPGELVSCSEAFVCVDGAFVCAEGTTFIGARACLLECQEFVADHPECSCAAADIYGYNVDTICP